MVLNIKVHELLSEQSKYNSLQDEYKSLIPTNNIAKLKKSILRRYKYLVPQLGKKLIIDAGVSITGLKLEKKISLKDLH